MRSLIIASVSALALLGLAACSGSGNDQTTGSIKPSDQQTQPAQQAPQVNPAPAPSAPADNTQNTTPAPSQ